MAENRGQMTEDREQSALFLLSSVFCALSSVFSKPLNLI